MIFIKKLHFTHSRWRIFIRAIVGLAAVLLAYCAGFQTAEHSGGKAVCTLDDLTDVPDVIPTQAQEVGIDPELKRVFLTFDDGPSKNTEKVLQILADNQVTATFFVVTADNNLDYLPLVKRESEQGCQVALHSCTHSYRQIYSSTDAFWTDIEELKKHLSEYIDTSTIDCIRFPGGSTNTVSRKYGGSGIMKQLKQQAEERGYHWVDWNVCAEDAAGGKPSSDQIYRNVIQGAKEKKDCVVLMHDTAATGNTIEALPDIIRWFKENGYTFYTISELYR